jgi:hypothetical protein
MTATTAVRERGIIMSGPLVPPILRDEKTKTRRTWGLDRINESPNAYEFAGWGPTGAALFRLNGSDALAPIKCPYGQPGDRLWVRETWAAEFFWPEPGGGRQRQWNLVPAANRLPSDDTFVAYRSTGTVHGCENNAVDPVPCGETGSGSRWIWKPSIHMPRWASRLTLEITDLRAERVQDISEEDAIAEGCFDAKEHDGTLPSQVFSPLWDSLNAPRGYSWESNPWVWCISFARVTP